MIAFLRGTIAFKEPTGLVIDVAGVGYRVGMSTQSLAGLGSVGSDATVLTYMQVKDDGIALFGFATEEERYLFEKLITVSGVGPKVALAALSTFSAAVLLDVIASEDVTRISSIPGVGKKTAQRIILELRGVLKSESKGADTSDANTARGIAEATEALLGMGFTSAEINLALKGFEGDTGDTSALVRFGLKRLGTA
jgi:Holliday junction DNA helicase RuvA